MNEEDDIIIGYSITLRSQETFSLAHIYLRWEVSDKINKSGNVFKKRNRKHNHSLLKMGHLFRSVHSYHRFSLSSALRTRIMKMSEYVDFIVSSLIKIVCNHIQVQVGNLTKKNKQGQHHL
ncbi:unnamed protein product [Lactuca virosa]|uniref:Uncharacterized protein n=1 Tax=Lactuca virosa TaxID=75947 RepID=A0AAU9MJ02_9ASTR|nr:unnamed protein product [Lactuca virosa]